VAARGPVQRGLAVLCLGVYVDFDFLHQVLDDPHIFLVDRGGQKGLLGEVEHIDLCAILFMVFKELVLLKRVQIPPVNQLESTLDVVA